ncbi:hypothetical protein LX87_02397 [Larkinella arboricola]|uniref:Uncharacterized protein n=1 Tax=Larkinella arboricola TaxID=643671 RepID=A0A327WYN1_LARAB|nr:hypothetical protein [Larkinella arboricola]RAJ97495.1 hypothetical protein LX87_02397 [Larkinella arboricola]
MKKSYLIGRCQELLAKVDEIARRQRMINQRLKELSLRLDAIEQDLETCRTPINTCIDFIPFKTPPAKVNWAILYVYATRFKDGYYLSAN